MDLSSFVQNIIGKLKQIKCPDDNRVSLWTAITLQISSGGTCFGKYVDIIQKVKILRNKGLWVYSIHDTHFFNRESLIRKPMGIRGTPYLFL